jgi:hypothetical protein
MPYLRSSLLFNALRKLSHFRSVGSNLFGKRAGLKGRMFAGDIIMMRILFTYLSLIINNAVSNVNIWAVKLISN